MEKLHLLLCGIVDELSATKERGKEKRRIDLVKFDLVRIGVSSFIAFPVWDLTNKRLSSEMEIVEVSEDIVSKEREVKNDRPWHRPHHRHCSSAVLLEPFPNGEICDAWQTTENLIQICWPG